MCHRSTVQFITVEAASHIPSSRTLAPAHTRCVLSPRQLKAQCRNDSGGNIGAIKTIDIIAQIIFRCQVYIIENILLVIKRILWLGVGYDSGLINITTAISHNSD